jgi:hypothetical protein
MSVVQLKLVDKALIDRICWRIALQERDDSDRLLRANMHKDVFLQGWLEDWDL